MSHTLIDIMNNLIKYNDKEIIIIIDNKNIPWFLAIDVANVLEYNNTRKAIIKNTDKNDRTSFDNLKQFVTTVPKNMKPHAVFINESGLYSLILNSQKPIAKQFRTWVTSTVLPSIRKTGSYQIEKEHQSELNELNQKLKEAKKQIRILKHNQKKKNYKAAGLIYVIRPIDTSKPNLLKVGKTTDFNKRLSTYNTSVPDDVDILFTLEVNDPDAVEHCLKGLLSKYVYRKNKEYYECTLKKIKEVIARCDKLVHDNYYCENCQKRVSFIDHFSGYHLIDTDDNLYLDLVVDQNQTGGKNQFDESFCVEIKNMDVIETYCKTHLYPYVDKHNKIYYECPINKIKSVLSECKENCQIDDNLNNLTRNDFTESDLVLIDIPTAQPEQTGGYKYMPSEEFTKKIIVGNDGCVFLPNGAMMYPNGKVVCPF